MIICQNLMPNTAAASSVAGSGNCRSNLVPRGILNMLDRSRTIQGVRTEGVPGCDSVPAWGVPPSLTYHGGGFLTQNLQRSTFHVYQPLKMGAFSNKTLGKVFASENSVTHLLSCPISSGKSLFFLGNQN